MIILMLSIGVSLSRTRLSGRHNKNAAIYELLGSSVLTALLSLMIQSSSSFE